MKLNPEILMNAASILHSPVGDVSFPADERDLKYTLSRATLRRSACILVCVYLRGMH